MRAAKLCLSAALSLSLTTFSQQPTQPPAPATSPATPAPQSAANTLTSNARLVILDAVVVDAKGNAITDLKRDDFQVTEDNAAQVIRNFETPGRYTPSPDVIINSTADLDRLAPRAPVNIVLLDEFNTRFEDMAFARYSLKKWLEKQPARLDTPTMLIAVDLQHFSVLRDYTQNKDDIIASLDHHFAAYPWQTHQGAWVAERYTTAFYTLRRVAEATIGHFGHKNMLWLGRGFPTLNFARTGIDDQGRVRNAVQDTVNELRDARVTLYTIDPAGVMSNPGLYGNDARDFAPFGGDPDFQALARATGGRNLYGRNDVDTEIGTSIRDGASLYTLVYRPASNDNSEFKFRKIKVTVNRPGLTVVTRQGYYPAMRAARPNKEGQVGRKLATELINAESSNMAYDAVPFTVQSLPTDANALRFRVEGRGLSWYFGDGTNPRFTRLIVVSTTFDKKGKELKRDARLLKFDAPADAPAQGLINKSLGFEVKLAPDPKAVRARLVVRVEATGRMGTADMMLGAGATAQSSSAGAAVLVKIAPRANETAPAPTTVPFAPAPQ